MSKQTAVEFLIEEVECRGLITKELRLCFRQAEEMEKEQKIKNISDYNIKVTEFLLSPIFNLEHSVHGIACEKLSDIRNQFISDNIINYDEKYGGNKWIYF